jgi:phosphonate transport system substrate-binding protein
MIGNEVAMRVHLKFCLPRCCVFFLVAFELVSLLGCSSDDPHKKVNFSNTIAVASPNVRRQDSRTLHVAVAAMVSPKETLNYYRELLTYLADKLDYDVRLIQRRTYREVNELFAKGQLDLAFICTGPYVNGRERYGFEGLATPIIHGQPFYQAYLIVNEKSAFNTIEQLRGTTFAFTDPDSNTGALVPQYWLAMMGERPASFFGDVIYTYSHDNSIMAVARTLVDAAAVDGHQWEYYNRRNPQYTRLTRVIKKSKPFGNPPLVAAASLAPEMKAAIQHVLLAMHADPAGKAILDQLLIDRFVVPREKWYQSVRDMYQKVQSINANAVAKTMAPHT